MNPLFRPSSDRNSHRDLHHRAFFVEQICLIVVIQIIFTNLLSHVFAHVDQLVPAVFLQMRISSAFAGLCAAAALFLTESGRSRRFRIAGQTLALGTAAIAVSTIWSNFFQPSRMTDLNQSSISALVLVLLSLVILLIGTRDSPWSLITDGVVAALGFVVLVLTSEFFFGLARIPGSSILGPVKIPTLVCFILLTFAVAIRRSEHGIFSIFLATGMDGRFARILAPLLIALPLLREIGRARLLDSRLVPAHYATAILTSIATLVSFALLLLLSRFIYRMQMEIQHLNLRDELTGLYNYRGFNLFAEQAYRLARRSGQPFGVLFVDMDNLKIINDQLGHSAGSVCLVETARVLSMTFRETDVIGRLGGDEFVVAGQFNQDEIEHAMERLRAAAAARTNIVGKSISLSLSMGYAAAESQADESLKTVVARADKAMYKEKRSKKKAFA